MPRLHQTLALVATLALGASASAQPRRLLLTTAEPDRLSTLPGLSLGSCQGGLCTATAASELDLARLRRLTGQVERSARRRPMLDRSLPAAGVTEAVRDLGLDGEGVLVVVIDTGVDWRHPVFAGPEFSSRRIEALIDLSLPPQGLHPDLEETLGGAAWVRSDLEAALAAEAEGEPSPVEVISLDTNGHGTHVASIAAGRDGVAPGASLVAVRVNREDWPATFEDADVLDAARFAFDLADQRDRPAVVILALGGHQGAHDGTSLLELGLSELVGPEHPGRAIVVAAGNSGGCQEHAQGVLDDESREVILEVLREDESLAVDLELWSPPEAELSLWVLTPTGDALGPVAAGEDRSATLEGAHVTIENAPFGPSPQNGDLPSLVSLRARLDGPIDAGAYRVRLEGRGRFDAYLSFASQEQLHGAARLSGHLSPDGTLTVPGTAEALIVVGASVTRRGWLDQSGRTWLDDRYELGQAAPYSGSGPTRSGALKPDLVAPGHAIIAALSREAEPGGQASVFTPTGLFTPTRWLVVPPGDRAVLWGTSLAAPHVAGVIALLLQLDPSLDQGELRALLIASARVDGGAARRAWSPRWGFGELDAGAAVRLLRQGFSDRAVDPARSALGVVDDVVAPGACTTVTVIARDAEERPLGPGHLIELSAGAGPTGEALLGEDGVSRTRWCAGGARPGSAVTLSARVDGVALDRTVTVHVAEDRGHIGPWAAALGGGCDVTATLVRPTSLLRLLELR